MPAATTIQGHLVRMFGWRRVRVALIATLVLSLLLLPGWKSPYWSLLLRLMFVAFVLLLVFGLFERWPARLPRGLARWVLQVAAVACAVPVATWVAYTLIAFSGVLGEQMRWWTEKLPLEGFGIITVLGLLSAPWIAVAALLRQIKGEARTQALAFELERSEYERGALDARLRLLRAQVEPHFLFNTLANVRELVDTGSPRASDVLNQLIA